ncbi:MAG: TonB-dependent receptor plug domain-containing protein [Nitrospinales bacterium]
MNKICIQLITISIAVIFFTGYVKADSLTVGNPQDFTELSLEALMEVTVTSVSKKEESFMDATSAIYVITQEDIRRSGVTSIPEALRMAPGMQVARISSNIWAITTRGFNTRFASNLLILIDGRSVYQIVTSGVDWDRVDVVLEDVDRIEVIRGPGGTLWGANAVNGVINIITKNSKDTQGTMVSAGAGNEEEFFETIRYGAKLAEGVYLRAYEKYFRRDKHVSRGGDPAMDEWDAIRGGFRLDWDISESDSLTFQGSYYDGTSSNWAKDVVTGLAPTESFRRDQKIDGGFFLARWEHLFSPKSDMALQFYYNRERRLNGPSPIIVLDTFDIDFQHRFPLGEKQEIVWGFEERVVLDSFDNENFPLSFTPTERVSYQFSGFVEDDIKLVPDVLKLKIGSKFEENNYTGFEFQPSVSLLWTPNEQHSIWASISRAVRIPARVEVSGRNNSNFILPPPAPTLVSFFGNENIVSEELLSYQVGYRVKPSDKSSLDITGFYNSYNNLINIETGDFVDQGTFALLPLTADNNGNANTFGIELAGEWEVFDWWKLKGGFTWFNIDFFVDPSSNDTTFSTQNNDPQFQGHLRSYINLPYNLEFDAAAYFVDEIFGFDSLGVPDSVPEYTRIDLRLGWRPIKELEFSLTAQNVQEAKHAEFVNRRIQLTGRTLVERSIFGKITWRP